MPEAPPYPPPSFIDPITLMQIGSLEFRARTVVEGFFAGIHRSPYQGFSVEFTEYRQYAPGDDPRRLDWKLFARSDRYFVKQYEDETNLRCHLLVDNSRSMAFGSLPYTKAAYAATIAATLGYYLYLQRDAVGLVRFDERIEEFIPARHRTGQFRRLLISLETPPAGQSTKLGAALEHIAQLIRKRGLLVLISDFLAPLDALETSLNYLLARGHEVIAFQTLDPAEVALDFDEPVLLRDMESGVDVYVEPDRAQQQYLELLNKHLADLDSITSQLGIPLHRLTTNVPLENSLLEFLHARQRASAGPRRSRNTAANA